MLRTLLAGSIAAFVGSAPAHPGPQSRSETAVVIDSGTPVGNRLVTIGTLQRLLAGLDDAGGVACFDVQAKGIEMMSNCAMESYAQSLFPEDRPRYSGVSLTLAEASAIQARNEAVRDGVINRECSDAAGAGQCGGRVHAAAVALIEDTQRNTEAKLEALRRLIGNPISSRVVVLITAGLPFRTEPRALNRLMSEFRSRRARLILVRLEAKTELKGMLSDAAQKLASRLDDVSSITLTNDRDIAKLTELIAPGPKAIAFKDPSPTAPSDNAANVVGSLREYVARFAREMRFVIAHERYDQEVRSRLGSFGANHGVVRGSRSTEAEVSFAHITDGVWIMARQVATVDGHPVGVAPSSPLADVRTEREAIERMNQLANDAAGWNIGSVRRNINSPTLAMWFLTDAVAGRFRFSTAGTERTAAGLCHVVRFREIGTPPLMEVEHQRTPAAGRFWVLGDSGAVVKTELVLERSAPSFRGTVPISRATITVEYTYWPLARFWVPATMVERYEQPAERNADIVIAKAIYSKYQQFTIGMRIK